MILQRKEKSKKIDFFGLQRIFSRKLLFLENQTAEDMKFCYGQKSFVLM